MTAKSGLKASDVSNALLAILARCSSEDELLSEIAIELSNLTGADACDIFFRDQFDSLVLRASNASPEMSSRFRLGKGKGISSLVIQSGEPFFKSSETESHPEYARLPGVAPGLYQASAILPLRTQGSTAMGVIAFKWTGSQDFSPAVQKGIVKAAELVSLSIKSFANAYSAGAQLNRLGALSEVTRTLTASPYLEEILQLLVNLTAQQFRYTVCTVRLLDAARGELVLRATQSPAKAYQKKRAIKLGESIAGRAISENRPIIVPDVQLEDDYIGHDLAAEQGLKSMICVPLTVRDHTVGVLSCYTSETRDFQDEEITALETLAQQAALSIENAKLQVRDTLMQEMHHRVKNNLQQVASLMRLQLRHGEYKSLDEALNDTLARILAIASVHDLLSREDLDHVGIRSIAEALVQHQLSSLIDPTKKIHFDVRGDDVTLSMTQATQIALVLNELILNSVEHGFEVCQDGDIHVNIEESNGDVSVWVSNNGDALPADFDISSASHLGLLIVENLSRALGGKFTLGNVLGWTVAEVKFSRSSGE